MVGPSLKVSSQLIWSNTVKVILSEFWFERNQRFFHDKVLTWLAQWEYAHLKASSWYSLSKHFVDLRLFHDKVYSSLYSSFVVFCFFVI